MARHPFSAVNLISDPIHGYVELTKRLAPASLRDDVAATHARAAARYGTPATARAGAGATGAAKTRAPGAAKARA